MHFVDVIAKKRDGHALSRGDIDQFVQGVTAARIPDYQSAALLMAIVLRGMSEEETAWLVELLTSGVTRLVTLTGPGGSGKTRLAIAVAGRLQELYGEAVAFVSLADLVDPGRLMETIVDGLGLPRSPKEKPLTQVVENLQGRRWLLVLDNFEHLVEGGATQLRTLLERVETLSCLVTSRQVLGLSGEQELALLPLPTPRRSEPLERLGQYPSVQLFVDRARAARHVAA